jgi:hypothetical protein
MNYSSLQPEIFDIKTKIKLEFSNINRISEILIDRTDFILCECIGRDHQSLTIYFTLNLHISSNLTIQVTSNCKMILVLFYLSCI